MANKTITQLDAAQSLNDNMVIAVQDTNTTYKTTLADVKAYCGAAPAGDKYKVGDRVKDDSDNPVGTVSSIFTDGNGDRYAVVCLDAVNRSTDGAQYLSSNAEVSGIPSYTNQLVWSAPETSTTNTTAILATGTSSACTFCRSKTFTIGGVSYAGQLPNLNELTQIFMQRTMINSQDPTATSYSSKIVPTGRQSVSSNQYNNNNCFYISAQGMATTTQKSEYVYFTVPVLEIPLED